MAAMDAKTTPEAWGCAALAEGARRSGGASVWRRGPNILPSQRFSSVTRAIGNKAGCDLCKMARRVAITSSGASANGGRDRTIRKKVNGHGMRALQRSLAGRSSLQHLRRTLGLFHQPAREHGASIFFNPLIEKSADLLAKIRGMTKPREFIALERSARSREQKLPRRLGLVAGHTILLENSLRKITQQ
jgi:hypothetical protein